jgi:GSCFA family
MFRTTLAASPAPFSIGHHDSVLLVGSCFTEHIGARLEQHKFRVTTNPYGILYNPVSLARVLDNMSVSPDHWVESQGVWYHLDLHGDYSAPTRAAAEAQVAQATTIAHDALNHASRIFITLGTADVFEWAADGHIVANCHKVEAKYFNKRRLSVQEVIEVLIAPIRRLTAQRPELRVVLTVSPVRHLRNGMVEHQRSKATLILACEAICSQMEQVHYFPAYELLMDDLRDYRFYADDLVHPSPMAVEYIWQHFCDTYFDAATQALNQQVRQVVQAAAHRPFHPDTEAHRVFRQQQLRQIEAIMAQNQHLNLDFRTERTQFGSTE